MAKKTVLTGVKPTNRPHIGNYLGAMQPALNLAKDPNVTSLFFIADYHALTSIHDAKKMRTNVHEVTACWLASGLDPDCTIIYRQSDVPEIFEFSWILSCFTPKGLMNRAHAYKARVAENQDAGKKDVDYGVNVGLFTYPVLMAADILLFNTDTVPVGEDQIQHVEIARDIAQKINNTYGDVLQLPEYVVNRETKIIPGLDGRKMSKSYENTIPLYLDSKKLRKLVMKIKTDSSTPEEPKDPSISLLFDLYQAFASETESKALAERYKKGVGWGEVKEILFELLEERFSDQRDAFNDYIEHPEKMESVLVQGAKKAREIAIPVLETIKKSMGIKF